MSVKSCPECHGKRRNYELMDKFERAEADDRFAYLWESSCACCRGQGYIYYGLCYPTLDELREALRDFRLECQAEKENDRIRWAAEMERRKDPAYLHELGRKVAARITRQIQKERESIAVKRAAVEKAIRLIEGNPAQVTTPYAGRITITHDKGSVEKRIA